LRNLSKLSKADRVECLLALCELPAVFGKPHLHSGLGIRKLSKAAFECRGTISLRFIFENRPADLFLSFMGNHDEIKALLKRGKYR
jgi:hypothetical protein